MSDTLEQHDFVDTVDLSEVRESLSKWDLESIYKDRELFDIFLNGCLGWNNQEPVDCIVEYVNTCLYHLEDKKEPTMTKLLVQDKADSYEVSIDSCGFSPFSVTIYQNGKKVYGD